MRKKLMYLILLVFVFSSALYFGHYINQQEYNRKYSIGFNESSIQYNLKNWLNRNDGSNLNPKIFDIKKLGSSSSYMVLFELENKVIGNAQLVKGRNNKLRIKQASYGDLNAYTFEDIKTNKGRYFLVMGKNPELMIDHIDVKVDYTMTYSYPINVSKDEFFYNYKNIPDDILQRPKIFYYDKTNKQLSDDELREIF
ncbi:hypothetical protein BACCIP111895_03211 [Neobacillus rhizosphaerae]|uniref:DUF4825 domain-containing protein n=1 Tax=Neobacillus rhizosphaerae TaxID=2880965 RepID=A0ABM9ETP9_9BACI|nr:hypothetical protein [Neobacillus rhizosphaerae]CAH2716027.1 hypothetical protein BACCIP111895_03211 [Neobacillus rhizosphaerae]